MTTTERYQNHFCINRVESLFSEFMLNCYTTRHIHNIPKRATNCRSSSDLNTWRHQRPVAVCVPAPCSFNSRICCTCFLQWADSRPEQTVRNGPKESFRHHPFQSICQLWVCPWSSPTGKIGLQTRITVLQLCWKMHQVTTAQLHLPPQHHPKGEHETPKEVQRVPM